MKPNDSSARTFLFCRPNVSISLRAVSLSASLTALMLTCASTCSPLWAQDSAVSVQTGATGTIVTPERAGQAAQLIGEALTLAERESNLGYSSTRLNALRGAAALLPALQGAERDSLTQRWLRLAMAGGVSRAERLDALTDFFDSGARRDGEFARSIAGTLPDDAARAGAYIALSERVEPTNWTRANEFALRARSAAREELNPQLRARALTFVAHRMATLNPDFRSSSVIEASSSVRALTPGRERDYLLAEVVGAAAKFDLPVARRVAADITDEGLKNLATARTNIAEISQTTVSSSTQDRVAALAQAAAKYDTRAIPILLQLPPQLDVIRALSDALPAIYPTARPAIDVSLLERMWNFSLTADSGLYKDQLQSRLARLMILHDLWRGRAWGKQLSWRGGRVQTGAFLKDVAQSRRSQLALRTEPLQDVAERSLPRAIAEARTLQPSARTEALLLIAGQILS